MSSHVQTMIDTAAEISLNTRQTGVLQRMYHAMWDGHFDNSIGELGYSVLLANEFITGGYGATLPDNQWIIEVNHFLATILTNIQIETTQYVAGFQNPAYNKYQVQPNTGDTEWMCRNQIVQSDDFASFNIFGLVIVFVIGALVIVINLGLDYFVRYIRTQKGNASAFKNLSWTTNNTLHLQSMAYEAGGMGVWNREKVVPITRPGDNFGLPTVSTTVFESESDGRNSSTAWSLSRLFSRKQSETTQCGNSSRNTWSMPLTHNKAPGEDVESKSLFRTLTRGLKASSTTTTDAGTDADSDLPSGDFMTHGFSRSLPEDTATKPQTYERVFSEPSPEISYS